MIKTLCQHFTSGDIHEFNSLKNTLTKLMIKFYFIISYIPNIPDESISEMKDVLAKAKTITDRMREMIQKAKSKQPKGFKSYKRSQKP